MSRHIQCNRFGKMCFTVEIGEKYATDAEPFRVSFLPPYCQYLTFSLTPQPQHSLPNTPRVCVTGTFYGQDTTHATQRSRSTLYWCGSHRKSRWNHNCQNHLGPEWYAMRHHQHHNRSPPPNYQSPEPPPSLTSPLIRAAEERAHKFFRVELLVQKGGTIQNTSTILHHHPHPHGPAYYASFLSVPI